LDDDVMLTLRGGCVGVFEAVGALGSFFFLRLFRGVEGGVPKGGFGVLGSGGEEEEEEEELDGGGIVRVGYPNDDETMVFFVLGLFSPLGRDDRGGFFGWALTQA
jgi:hypothetical protein